MTLTFSHRDPVFLREPNENTLDFGRGTTPELEFDVEDIDLSTADAMRFTVYQDGLMITKADDEIEVNGNKIKVRYSKEETLKFSTKTKIKAQLVVISGDMAYTSNIPIFSNGARELLEEKYQASGGYDGDPESCCDELKEEIKAINDKLDALTTSDSYLDEDLTASVGAGGINVGDHFMKGSDFEDLFRKLLNPVKRPTITPPSATIVPFGGYLLETGSVAGKTVRVDFNRGSIIPPYGTNGFRAGSPISYEIDGVVQDSDIFNIVVDESHSDWTATVVYEGGEQPKDSNGDDYDESLLSGSLTSSVLRFEFVDAIWSNQNDILTMDREPLISKSTKTKTFNFPAQTKTNPEMFDIPASWNVTKIEVYNDISRQFEDDAAEFTVTRVNHLNAAGAEVEYRRYTDNRGYAAGERQIRVTWA